MAEPRRLQFTTVQTLSTNSKPRELPPTVRLQLTLTLPTRNTCTEYSYLDLVRNTTQGDQSLELDQSIPNGHANADLAEERRLKEIAKAFESKYGKTKKKPKRIKDLVDLGDGYDENDTFIDNSEAYDELVPESLVTKHGGFYINRGDLDFRERTDSESCDISFVSTGSKRARRVTSDSDSDSDFIKKSGTKKKAQDVVEKSKKRLMKKLSRNNSEKKFLKPKLKTPDKKKVKQKTVSELLKNGTTTADQVNATVVPVKVVNATVVPVKVVPTKVVPIKVIPCTEPDQPTITPIPLPTKETSHSPPTDPTSSAPQPIPPLPDISPELHIQIDLMKQAAKQKSEGKSKFFTDNVNKILLLIGTMLSSMRLNDRNNIYAHLAAFLPVNKETLMKRGKKLRLAEKDARIKDLLTQLTLAVTVDMKKSENALLLAKSGGVSEGASAVTECGGLGADKVGDSSQFIWTPQTKELLCTTVSIHMSKVTLLKTRLNAYDEYLKTFLDDQVRPLWPSGCITTKELYDASLSAHSQYTIVQPKNLVGRAPTVSNPTKPTTDTQITSQTDSLNKMAQQVSKINHQTTKKTDGALTQPNTQVLNQKKPTQPTTQTVAQKKSVTNGHPNVVKRKSDIKTPSTVSTTAVHVSPEAELIAGLVSPNVYDVVKAGRQTSPTKHQVADKSPGKALTNDEMAIEIFKSLVQPNIAASTHVKKTSGNVAGKKRASDGTAEKKDVKFSKKGDNPSSNAQRDLSLSYSESFEKFSQNMMKSGSPLEIPVLSGENPIFHIPQSSVHKSGSSQKVTDAAKGPSHRIAHKPKVAKHSRDDMIDLTMIDEIAQTDLMKFIAGQTKTAPDVARQTKTAPDVAHTKTSISKTNAQAVMRSTSASDVAVKANSHVNIGTDNNTKTNSVNSNVDAKVTGSIVNIPRNISSPSNIIQMLSSYSPPQIPTTLPKVHLTSQKAPMSLSHKPSQPPQKQTTPSQKQTAQPPKQTTSSQKQTAQPPKQTTPSQKQPPYPPKQPSPQHHSTHHPLKQNPSQKQTTNPQKQPTNPQKQTTNPQKQPSPPQKQSNPPQNLPIFSHTHQRTSPKLASALPNPHTSPKKPSSKPKPISRSLSSSDTSTRHSDNTTVLLREQLLLADTLSSHIPNFPVSHADAITSSLHDQIIHGSTSAISLSQRRMAQSWRAPYVSAVSVPAPFDVSTVGTGMLSSLSQSYQGLHSTSGIHPLGTSTTLPQAHTPYLAHTSINSVVSGTTPPPAHSHPHISTPPIAHDVNTKPAHS